MGAAGAGLATWLSNCAACLYFFILLWIKRGRTFVCIDPRRISLRRRIVMGVCGVGIPASIQNLLNVTGMTLLNNLTSAYGADAVAAMGISYKIYMVPMYVSQGLSQGIMPLVSYNYASGCIPRMKGTVSFARRIALSLLVVVAALYFLFPRFFIALFMENAAILDYGSHFLRGFSLGLPFLCMDFLAVGVFQAVGMGREALAFALLRKIALEIPALALFNALFPLYGLAYAQFAAEVILAAASVVVLRRLFRRLEHPEQLPTHNP